MSARPARGLPVPLFKQDSATNQPGLRRPVIPGRVQSTRARNPYALCLKSMTASLTLLLLRRMDSGPAARAASRNDGGWATRHGASLSPCGRGWFRAHARNRVRGRRPSRDLSLSLGSRFADAHRDPPSPTRGEDCALRVANISVTGSYVWRECLSMTAAGVAAGLAKPFNIPPLKGEVGRAQAEAGWGGR